MARILILSSWVAHGHVGLSAAVPALQALGHSVTQLPTTLLSNHPGWPYVAGRAVAPDTLHEMIDALGANDWLAQHDAVLTGYLPSVAHVALAADLVKRLRESAPNALRVVVDPVMGDEPTGLYIPEAAACAIRDELCPLADILTPNLFELGWLADRPVSSLADTRAAAETLSALWNSRILPTSAPLGPERTGVMSLGEDGGELYGAPRLDAVPHGVGDVFSALIAAGLPASAALGHLNALVERSAGASHLRIVEAAQHWMHAAPLPAMDWPEEE